MIAVPASRARRILSVSFVLFLLNDKRKDRFGVPVIGSSFLFLVRINALMEAPLICQVLLLIC